MLAVVLLLGYEAALAVVSFVRGVATEVEKRWQARFVEKIDRILARRLARFDRRYREFVLGTLRFVDLKGLATIGPYTPQLDEVFVELELVPRSPHQVMSDPLADVPVGLTERSSLQDFLDQPSPRVLAVVGAAGSGKTTLLRHTARQICQAAGSRRRAVPIFLVLRDHAAEILANPDVALSDLERGMLGRYRTDEPAGWFEQKLRVGACVVLLDGLDEVTTQGDRRSVSDWVERQIGQYPDNDYVITSRPHGYRAAEIGGATVLQVRRFTDEQVARFVRGWYWSMERHSMGVDSGELKPHVVSAAADLLDRLRNTAALHELTVNPLLLTMIANVHHYRGALPGSRAELYSEICEVMLWRRHSAKKLPAELGGDHKELLLRQLAFTMMERRVRDLPRTLECVFFMRDVRSAQYFEQMKGRGARTISSADFRAVTPDATEKTRFVIVDAVGVTEHDFVDPPLNRQKGISLKKLLVTNPRSTPPPQANKVDHATSGRTERSA